MDLHWPTIEIRRGISIVGPSGSLLPVKINRLISTVEWRSIEQWRSRPLDKALSMLDGSPLLITVYLFLIFNSLSIRMAKIALFSISLTNGMTKLIYFEKKNIGTKVSNMTKNV